MITKTAKKLKRLLRGEDTKQSSTKNKAIVQSQWLDCEIKGLGIARLIEGAIALDQDAQHGSDADVLKLRVRAIEMIEAALALKQNQAEWVTSLHAKHLRECAFACDRLATAAEGDDVLAAQYWGLGAQSLEKLLVHFLQPAWVMDLYAKHLRECAFACDRLATAAEGDDVLAAKYWGLGAQSLEKFLSHIPKPPKWVAGMYAKQLREWALACDRLATAAKGDDVLAAQYWGLGAQSLEKLLARFPKSPKWIEGLYAKQLRKGALARNRLNVLET